MDEWDWMNEYVNEWVNKLINECELISELIN